MQTTDLTVEQVEASISEHKSKLVGIQHEFDELAKQIAEAELKEAKNLDDLKEQQFQLRHDVRHEEQALEHLDDLLTQAKKQDAIEQYKIWLKRYKEYSSHRRELKKQIDQLEAKLYPIKKEFDDGWQSQSHSGGRVDAHRRILSQTYGVDTETLDAIKSDILESNSKDDND